MEIIDLSYPIEEGMTTFGSSWHPIVEISQIGRIGIEGRNTRKISFGSHTGTHMDAPLHFINSGRTIDQIPLDLLIGPVSFLDFSFMENNGELSVEMLKPFQLKERVIFRFGWGKYWGSRKFYADYPFFSSEAANYLCDKGVRLIGLDTPSPDDGRIKLEKELLGSEKDSPIHKILLSRNIILVEYLANLEAVDAREEWNMVVLPLKIKGSDGSPVRAAIYR